MKCSSNVSQVTALPGDPEGGEPWASFAGSRDSQSNVPRFIGRTANDVDGSKFNNMPPGMDIGNQSSMQDERIPEVLSGENDVSHDVNAGAMLNGFMRRTLRDGSEDQDVHFCDEVPGGFQTRNNYLDRE